MSMEIQDLQEAAESELSYAVSLDTCDAHQVRKSARKLGFNPGLLMKLAVIAGSIIAAVKAAASGKPVIQALKIGGEPWWIAAGKGNPPQIPGA